MAAVDSAREGCCSCGRTHIGVAVLEALILASTFRGIEAGTRIGSDERNP